MDTHSKPASYLTVLILLLFIISCNNADVKKDKQIVSSPEQMDSRAADNIKAAVETAEKNNGKLDDSTRLDMPALVKGFYTDNEFSPIWSSKEKWQPLADTLYNYIVNAEQEGLFPAAYHLKNLQALKSVLDKDSLKRMDAVLWARADVMFTDGFMHIIRDLKQGRLQPDSLSLNKDTALANTFFVATLKELVDKKQFTPLITALQPKNKGYWALKKGIRSFLDSMDRKTYTYVTYPYKKGDSKDSVFFVKTLQKRLNESNCIEAGKLPDSLQLATALKKYQKQKGLTADGKVSTSLIRTLNTSDAERFKRIAITLDRYKQLPGTMPDKYIWVNLPGYYLQVWDHDTLALESKVICGKPDTRTPLLQSAITDMITYPTWTVPSSIIAKQYLPKLKNNPNYLSRLGLKLMNAKGEVVSGGDVNWSKYTKGIPFKVMQNSGDNNALGIFKFNFDNPYAVYLHDTNQRYLFKNSFRALSHGCVRVQEWDKLAYYIANNDSVNSKPGEVLKYTSDSIKSWIANKERHRMDVKNKIPLFIRYFSCEGKDGKIRFYDDIYGEDKAMREKYFAGR